MPLVQKLNANDPVQIFGKSKKSKMSSVNQIRVEKGIPRPLAHSTVYKVFQI